MVVEYKGNKINFEEVTDTFDSHGAYTKEVEVIGFDENGVEYSAMGIEDCDEIVEIDEDTIECELDYLVNNNPDDGSWVGR